MVWGAAPAPSDPITNTLNSLNPSDMVKTVNQVLGVVLLIGGCLYQLPQVLRIRKQQSSIGMSEIACHLQNWGGLFYCAYNWIMKMPFLSWGDTVPSLLLGIYLVHLVWKYHPRLFTLKHKGIHLSLIALFISWIYTGKFPKDLVPALGLAPLPLTVLGRLPQVLLNYRQGHTGELSAVTLALQCAGNLVRLFGVLTLYKDKVVLLSHLVALLCNAAPLLQVFYYWNTTNEELNKAQHHREH